MKRTYIQTINGRHCWIDSRIIWMEDDGDLHTFYYDEKDMIVQISKFSFTGDREDNRLHEWTSIYPGGSTKHEEKMDEETFQMQKQGAELQGLKIPVCALSGCGFTHEEWEEEMKKQEERTENVNH